MRSGESQLRQIETPHSHAWKASLGIVFIALINFFYLGLQLTHALHRFGLFLVQRKEGELEQKRDQNNADAVVGYDFIEQVQRVSFLQYFLHP